MDQSPALYAESAVAQVVAPWLADHLPRLDPTVVHRLVQLTTGMLEHQSLLIEEIARGSTFRATAEMPPRYHGFTPYLAAYVWHRVGAARCGLDGGCQFVRA